MITVFVGGAQDPAKIPADTDNARTSATLGQRWPHSLEHAGHAGGLGIRVELRATRSG